MDFNESNKAIYLQIADVFWDKVLEGTLRPADRVPSVREYAATVMVNVNTVMRTYDYLSTMGVIYNKRGVGYFVADDAESVIVKRRIEELMDGGAMERILRQWSMLHITPDTVAEMYNDYLNRHNNEKDN